MIDKFVRPLTEEQKSILEDKIHKFWDKASRKDEPQELLNMIGEAHSIYQNLVRIGSIDERYGAKINHAIDYMKTTYPKFWGVNTMYCNTDRKDGGVRS